MADDVVDLLRSLPPQLPGPADRFDEVRRRVVRRRRRMVGGAVVSVVGLLALAPLAWHATRSEPAPQPLPATAALALACPDVYGGETGGGAVWVPAGPDGVDGSKQLVPARAPERAIVCAYEGTNMESSLGRPLGKSRVLAGDFEALAAELSELPPVPTDYGNWACRDKGGPETNYLVGLTYAAGTLWVSTGVDPNSCTGTGNGDFLSRTGVGAEAARALREGRWLPKPLPVTTNAQALEGRWLPVSIKGYDGELPGVGEGEAYLTFKRNGQVSGYNGCNWLSGTYELSQEAFVGKVGKTYRACIPRSDAPITDAIWAAVAVRVVGDTLTLLGKDDETLAVFTRSSSP